MMAEHQQRTTTPLRAKETATTTTTTPTTAAENNNNLLHDNEKFRSQNKIAVSRQYANSQVSQSVSQAVDDNNSLRLNCMTST